MSKVTLATFNCENLFQRFKFTAKATPQKVENAVKNGFPRFPGVGPHKPSASDHCPVAIKISI